MDASLRRFDELGNICVAWVECRICVDDSDDGPGECIFAITKCFDKYLSQEEREMGIAVRCQALPKT